MYESLSTVMLETGKELCIQFLEVVRAQITSFLVCNFYVNF